MTTSSKTLLASILIALSTSTLPAQNIQKGTYGYLYCHMSDNGEFTAYALSRDGLHYHDLNGAKPLWMHRNWQASKVDNAMPTYAASPIQAKVT